MEVDRPVERLPIDHINQNQADRRAACEAGQRAERREQRALRGEHAADLRAGEAEMAQHAELSPAREHHGAEAGREAEQADEHGDGLHRVSDGEAAVEDA